jgi:hypothetical protein
MMAVWYFKPVTLLKIGFSVHWRDQCVSSNALKKKEV